MSGWGWVLVGYGLTAATWGWLVWITRTPRDRGGGG